MTLFKLVIFSLLLIQPAFAETIAKAEVPQPQIIEVEQTVLKMPLAPGVSPEDASMSINLKAEELNMKKVGYLPVSDELKARGLKSQHLEIFQFCNPEDAMKMVTFNTLYAAYMPCRIALVEDSKGQYWLQMLNLDMVISKYQLPEDLRRIAITINGQMLEIITAGSQGSL